MNVKQPLLKYEVEPDLFRKENTNDFLKISENVCSSVVAEKVSYFIKNEFFLQLGSVRTSFRTREIGPFVN